MPRYPITMNKNKIFVLIFISHTLYAETFCIAHRGFSGKYVENSFESFDQAVAAGTEGLEMDIQHTKDLVPMVFHDDDLKRVVQSKKGKFCPTNFDMNRVEFKRLRENCELKNNQDIPTLQEFFERYKNFKKFFFVEFKDQEQKQSMDLIELYFKNKIEQLRILSFEYDILVRLKNTNNTFWNNVHYNKLVYKGPMPDINQSEIKSFGINFKLMNELEKQRPLVEEANVWTVNDVNDMKKVFESKYQFLTTNFPDQCVKLKSN
jgi:glycerophosphoryl diester phosphodiesterase